MGNCQERQKHKLTTEHLDATERAVLNLSGVNPDLIVVKDVPVGEYKNTPVTIRTCICGTADKPTLVLCHGYGGSGPLFFKVIAPLIEKFHLILIDIIGMGGSSRPKDYKEHKFTPQESIDYFNQYFENWRVAMGNLTGFYLAAHSFGGYVMGNYAVKYHQHIK